MKINGGTLPKVTARAKRFARFDNLNDVKKKFQISTLRREDVSNVSAYLVLSGSLLFHESSYT